MMTKRPTGLILDDDADWRNLMIDILSEVESELMIAKNFSEAEALIKSERFTFAVLDISLSTLDHSDSQGLEILKLLKRTQPECACFMLTGFSTVEIAVSAIVEFGARNFFRKEALKTEELTKNIMDTISANSQKLLPELYVLKDEFNNSSEITTESNWGSKALIIEDDDDWANFHSDWLEGENYENYRSSNPTDALEKLNSLEFSLVVLDLTFNSKSLLDIEPATNSTSELLNKLRNNNLPVLIITGTTNLEAIDKLYGGINIQCCFNKADIELSTLLAIVRNLKSDPKMFHPNMLTFRERDVINLLIGGLTNKIIARQLFITPNTVKRHLKSIYKKLNVNTRSGAVAKYLENKNNH